MFTFYRVHRTVKRNSVELFSATDGADFEVSYGHKLKAWRLSHGLTQEQFAERVGFSDKFVSQHERENGKPSERYLQKSAEVTGIPFAELTESTEKLNDSAEARSKDSRHMKEESLQDYRAALLWLASHLDDAHLHRLREAVWNEPETAVPRAVKLFVFDALMAGREKQQRRAVPKN